ncbi:hypothetical protein HanXRQr2_Chr11g0485621 [Helianthus annuus]|uniref:Uncharacterized protein n=1 Tax=Helianthus annuus TaxID=4232 RepID=A0A9K3HNJ1_HELAN|nr:hypothetical protein HanXRQr2_Chr11g0485621 [Helianthus annuus]
MEVNYLINKQGKLCNKRYRKIGGTQQWHFYNRICSFCSKINKWQNFI